MNTTCSPCATSPITPLATQRAGSTLLATARAWWVRWMVLRQPQRTESDLTALDGLTTDTLNDIGAPEWMYARALRAEVRARQGGLFERDSIHWR
jgi:hypothetical protein